MPSNDSPAFDVMSAEENDLWEWAVERAGVENAATYIRDETLKAVRARQTERGESQAPEAEPMDADTERNLRERIGTLRKERDEARTMLAERDTDLARARVEGAREALDRVASMSWAQVCAGHMVTAFDVRVLRLKESDYPLPAPKPAECRLSWHDAGYMKSHLANSDGKVLGGVRGTTYEWTAWVYGAGDIGQYIAESKAKRAVEAFAATPTEARAHE